MEAYVNAGYKGIVFAGVGDGNLNQATLDLAAQAAKTGVMIVRSSRIPYGGVYTEGGEVDDFSKSNITYARDIEELAAVAGAEGSEDELIEYIHLLRGVSVAFLLP